MPATYPIPGLQVIDHTFSLPLDHARAGGPQLSVFARELVRPGGEGLPHLLYLQGGPGIEAPRPVPLAGWLKRALQDYRVVLLDQRGTGRSTPVGGLPGLSAAEQAGYLRHFRADAIVNDAECIREALGLDRWSVLGQSFGGFCALHYLSAHPAGLREVFITGGLPPLARPVAEVYQATYARLEARTRLFYDRYPQDRARVREVCARLDNEEICLPGGERLSARRFRQLGHLLGMGDGLERLHFLLDFAPDSLAFAYEVQAALPFGRNPLYAVIHESCYADGVVTDWAAERVRPTHFGAPDDLTGEMIYRWMFSEYAELRPLAGAAELLAQQAWEPLYSASVLRENRVPVAAAVYADDMFVERRFSEETAAGVGNLRLWLTNEYQHNGLRADGERVLGQLIGLLRDPA